MNPGPLVYFAALVLGGGAGAGDTESGAVGAVATGVVDGSAFAVGAFAIGAFAASASWQLALTTAGAALGRFVTGPTGQLIVAALSSVIMAALGVGLILR